MTAFLISVVAGMVAGAPVGVIGALVADAALLHRFYRLLFVIIAAVMGDFLVALAGATISVHLIAFFQQHHTACNLITGAVILALGVAMAYGTWKNPHPVAEPDKSTSGPTHWLLGHAAPPLVAFLIATLHPGSLLFILSIIAFIQQNFPELQQTPLLFATGISLGSAIIFAFSGVVFWKIRQYADKFLYLFRYALAGLISIMGFVFLLKPLF